MSKVKIFFLVGAMYITLCLPESFQIPIRAIPYLKKFLQYNTYLQT